MDVESLVNELNNFVHLLRGCGYRGLVIVFAEPTLAYQILSKVFDDKELRKLLVYWPGRGVDAARQFLKQGWDFVFIEHIRDKLGQEYDIVVIDCFEGLQANTLAAAAEMVSHGGVLVLTGEDWNSFSMPGSLATFSKRLKKIIDESEHNVFVVNAKNGVVIRKSLACGPRAWLPGVSIELCSKFPSWLCRLACCDEQLMVVNALEDLIKSYEAGVLLITGDRGRGKSASVGLALAYLIWKRLVGDVVVTGPSLYTVQTLFEWLARGLKEARIRFKAWGPARLYQGLKGAWFRVRFEEPWRVEGAPLVVIDEAAAVGPARVRRIVSRSRNVVAVTTVHGYEGSGLYWLRVLLRELPKPSVIELKTPVRYAPNDPLERIVRRALLLEIPDPEELPICKYTS